MSGTHQSILLTVGLSEKENQMMKNALSNEFIIVEPHDAQSAMKVLTEETPYGMLLLNLIPPCTDGWSVLETMQREQLLTQYPVLVLTDSHDEESRKRALEMGASDVLLSLMEPHLAIKRIHNLLRMVQLDAFAKSSIAQVRQLERQSEKARIAEVDGLTGLSTLAAFCHKVTEIVKDRPAGSYVIVRWDIDRFKIYKDIYGANGGDDLIRYIGQRYQERPEWYSCHAGTDHFIHLVPIALFNPDETSQTIQDWLNSSKNKYTFVPRIGVYVVDDPELDANIMCDRAQLALLTLKGNYQKNIAYYDHSIRKKLREEQELIGDMEVALADGQFHVYLQPQYNHSDGSIVGAEALVRWFHPTKGLIPPGAFIPVFERNGFINKLDTYMWEQVCSLLRRWIDQGRDVVPISVNISRVDIADSSLLVTLNNIVEKYRIPEALLRLEITESAYMDNPEQLITMVNRLRERGFLVEMDDFGSGYSSLNMLKNVPVDVLKLDMKFLSSIDERGGNILNSVVRMAHWLDLPVIAEGVETLAQADYLHSVGCQVMQGYYYARPMPVTQFEELMETASTSAPERSLPDTVVEGSLDFIDPTTQAALLFSSFVGGAAIMEYDGVELESLRINERYLEELQTTNDAYHTHRKGLMKHIHPDHRQLLVDALNQAERTGKQQQCEFMVGAVPPNEGYIWLHVHIRFLARNMNHLIYYFDITNTTSQQQLMSSYLRLNDEMNGIINNVPGGILHLEIVGKEARIAYCNEGAAELFGYDQDEFIRRFAEDPDQALHPEDRHKLYPVLKQALEDEEGKEHSVRYRTRMKNGGWRWTQMYAQKLNKIVDGKRFITAVVISMDELAEKDLLVKDLERELHRKSSYLQTMYHCLPCGVMRYVMHSDGRFELARYNDAAWQIFGFDNELQYQNAIFDGNTLKYTHPEDLRMVQTNIRLILGGESSRTFEHRIIRADGSVRWVQVILRRFSSEQEEDFLMTIFTDITDQVKNQTKMYRDALLSYMDELYEVDLAQDTIVAKDHRSTSGDVRSFSSFIEQWCMHVVAEEDRVQLQTFFAQMDQDERSLHSIRHGIYHTSGRQRAAETTLIRSENQRYLLGVKYLAQDMPEGANALQPGQLLQNPFELMQHGEEETQFHMAALAYDTERDTLSYHCSTPDGQVFRDTLENYLTDSVSGINPFLTAEAKECVRHATMEAGNHAVNYGCEIGGGQMGWFRLILISLPDEDGRIRIVRGTLMNNRQRVERTAIAQGLSADFSTITSNFQYSLAEMLMRVTAAGCDSTKITIETIMRNVGQQLGLRRMYVVRQEEDDRWTTAFEWCAGGVTAQMAQQQQIRFKPSLKKPYYHYFDGNGVLIGPMRVGMYPELMELPYQVSNAIHVALEYGGSFHGFVGFECNHAQEIEGHKVSIAMVVAMSLSILMGQRTRLRERLKKDLEHKQANQYIQDRYNCIMKQTGVYLINWNETDNVFGIQFFHQGHNLMVEDQGQRVLEHIHPDDREALVVYFQDELWKQNRTLNLRMQMQDGIYRWMRLGSAQPERRGDGKINIIAALVDMDEAANASEALLETNQRFEDIVNNIPIGIGIFELLELGTAQSRLVYASDNLISMFGLDRETFMAMASDGRYLKYLPDMTYVNPQLKERFWKGDTVQMRKEACREDGSSIWLSYVCRLLQRKGKIYCYVSVTDVSERVAQERKEIWQQERYRLISEVDKVVVFDYSPADDVMTFTKKRPGQPSVEETHANYLTSMESRLFYIHQDDLPNVRQHLINACQQPTNGTLEFLGRYFSDDYRWQRIRYVSVGDENGRVYRVVGCIDDVNDERILHNQLQQRAQRDGTTGLMNKDTGRLNIDKALLDMPTDRVDAVLFVDIDNFKTINDSLGHMEGDAILRRTADCLTSLFRQDDIIARFGGDEFIVYMHNAQTVDALIKKADTLTEAINRLRMKNGEFVHCSVGMTIAHPKEEFSEVFERIDAALYLAKTAGKNRHHLLLRKEN
ncbi:MAG: EAL domain-containing protein [Clostridiales bacterium]|nr:EAL domain-containing protein [Clostridiales bacterium]